MNEWITGTPNDVDEILHNVFLEKNIETTYSRVSPISMNKETLIEDFYVLLHISSVVPWFLLGCNLSDTSVTFTSHTLPISSHYCYWFQRFSTTSTWFSWLPTLQQPPSCKPRTFSSWNKIKCGNGSRNQEDSCIKFIFQLKKNNICICEQSFHVWTIQDVHTVHEHLQKILLEQYNTYRNKW